MTNRRDENRVPNISGVSSLTFDSNIEPAVDPVTHELLTQDGALIDGSQKTQIVDAGGEQATVTNNKLDVNATPPLTAGFVGQTKIAVTGTAVQLSAQVLTNGVIITAKSSNTGNLKIGGSGVTNTEDGTGNGYILEPGASCSIAVTNTNVIYFNGTAGDILSWVAC